MWVRDWATVKTGENNGFEYALRRGEVAVASGNNGAGLVVPLEFR